MILNFKWFKHKNHVILSNTSNISIKITDFWPVKSVLALTRPGLCYWFG